MVAWLLMAVAGATGWEVDVTPIRGETARGELVSVSADEVRLETADGPRSFDRRELLTVQPAQPSPLVSTTLEQAPLIVRLTDGSLVPTASYTVAGRRIELETVNRQSIRTTTRAVHWVRFYKPQSQTNDAWDRIVNAERTGDCVVIRKTSREVDEVNAQPAAIALDYLEGILGDVTPTHVGFEFDGTEVEVPREKVEGIIYRHPPSRSTTEPIARVVDLAGGVYHARTVATKDDTLELVTDSGVRLALPLSEVTELDFSLGNIDYLSDLDPESVTWKPRHELVITPATRRWFQPERNEGLDGQPLQLGGQSYEKGLALHSHTEMRYRLTKPYKLLLATVGIDDETRQQGELDLQILGDGAVLFERRIAIGQDPFDLELDVQGVRRLSLIVGFGDDSDRGDNLNLCNVRLVK